MNKFTIVISFHFITNGNTGFWDQPQVFLNLWHNWPWIVDRHRPNNLFFRHWTPLNISRFRRVIPRSEFKSGSIRISIKTKIFLVPLFCFIRIFWSKKEYLLCLLWSCLLLLFFNEIEIFIKSLNWTLRISQISKNLTFAGKYQIKYDFSRWISGRV